jgi:hypothetical protein
VLPRLDDKKPALEDVALTEIVSVAVVVAGERPIIPGRADTLIDGPNCDAVGSIDCWD